MSKVRRLNTDKMRRYLARTEPPLMPRLLVDCSPAERPLVNTARNFHLAMRGIGEALSPLRVMGSYRPRTDITVAHPRRHPTDEQCQFCQADGRAASSD